ncbi:nudix hydrolase 9 isoform X2 [Diospyros lotus]|uniref:nudix hydrolase 9 isoform X2 n=1 Tax=Diospyros lotus TaxID=55363 RepID=UPI00224F671C|nr:nudix hydrolase 9 isoform X2 [Diospyros lotus]
MEKPNAEPVLDPPAYKLLLTCPSGLSPSQVSVVFDEAYDRIPHPAINLEDSISQIWDQRVQQNASFFNGKKFRVCQFALEHKFVSYDCKQCQHTSSPLGNGAVVETSDKRIIVLQRSYNVGEFPGHYVFPGGHPEPQEVGIVSHQYDRDSKDAEIVNKKISQEMFDSIVREVVEEIGVPAASLCSPVFIGISRRVLNVRPAAFFFIKCSLESKEIQQLYSSAQDGYESTQIFTVSMNDLENMASKMPGCHQGGLALYKLMVEATKDT